MLAALTAVLLSTAPAPARSPEVHALTGETVLEHASFPAALPPELFAP